MFILQRRRESKAFFESMERCRNAVGHRSQWKTLKKKKRRSIWNSMSRSISLNNNIACLHWTIITLCAPFQHCGGYYLRKILLCAQGKVAKKMSRVFQWTNKFETRPQTSNQFAAALQLVAVALSCPAYVWFTHPWVKLEETNITGYPVTRNLLRYALLIVVSLLYFKKSGFHYSKMWIKHRCKCPSCPDFP